MQRLFAGVVVAALAWPALALGATLRVPEEHSTIQEAINQASPSSTDTVSIAAGTYRERVSVRKTLVLRGRAGAEQTILDGQFAGNVLTVNGVSRSCIIEDLTFTGGDATEPDSVGAAIYLNSFASPTIQRCRMVGNRARTGGGLNAYVNCQPLVKDCWIADNQGGAVVIELDDPDGSTYAEFVNTVIADNLGNGIVAIKGARVWIRNCTIANHNAEGVRTREFARVRITNSIIAHNDGAGILREDPTVCFTLQCNDVYGNAGGNYVGTNPTDTCFPGRGSGDVSVDPCFQNAAADNYHLTPTSPLCSLRQPGSCGVLGAYEDPCSGTVQLCTDAVTPSTWTAVKGFYR